MMMNNKYKTLLGNSALFAIGNLGSKLISFLMLPLYTYQMTSGSFGQADLIQTTVSLLLPVVSLSIFDAILRFGMDRSNDRSEIFSNGVLVTLVSSVLVLILGGMAEFLGFKFALYLTIILIMQSIQSLFSQYSKAIGKVQIFAANGILMSLVTAFFNVLLLVVFHLGIRGYLLSIVFANLFSNIYLLFRIKLYNEFSVEKINFQKLKDMLRFSAPLIPNSVAWWITNTISRYFILFFINVKANGIFAVANKIPSLISVLDSIFYQSWQISAVKEYGSENKGQFYSDIFYMYSELLFLGVSGVLFILRPMMSILVSKEFDTAWKYVPFLLLTVVYSGFSGFLGQYYIAAKKTTGVFTTTVVGALLNVIFNFIFIPTLGLMGAGVSSALSFAILWLIRIRDTQKFVRTKFHIKNMIGNHIIIGLQILVMFSLNGSEMYVFNFLFLIISFVLNRKIVLSTIDMIVNLRPKHRIN
ncbi:polysaccharide biosynthesis C-terminal domain-containing protein [Pediococcus inopinatus]|uniref:Polysaccharide biosynthesis C-terminal domain-containing protein n=1 Tax=Pediococcus inopinatus TaxID=114090 RepID=A0ABZ0Q5Y4_9LACO|nr:polysaccharide biosynthesis C-terminal domain-containing protein [Pediococcus inopinatus]WPC22386.1 polysaccharide biosynthesis C-terminal domain-containing protein [Pediococcus inopinatus]